VGLKSKKSESVPAGMQCRICRRFDTFVQRSIQHL